MNGYLKFMVRNSESGVKFRGQQRADYVVAGYRADIDQGEGCLGWLCDDPGRGLLRKPDEKEVAEHFRKNQCNDLVITCIGPRIRTELNGYTMVEYTEENPQAAKEGVVALQLWCTPPCPKMKVWFKDIRIKPLPEQTAAAKRKTRVLLT